MAIRNILTESNDSEFLSKKCRPVEKFDERLASLLDDMAETLHQANGVGLAAIQVGVLRRVVVIDIGDGVKELVNPVIVEQSGEQESLEGCLSIPGKWGITKRPKHVKVRAQDRHGNWFEYEGDDLLATVSCHEIDHLDGVLFLKHVVRMLTEEELEKMSSKSEDQ
ncbi:MAG: Peptide deformylase [Thermocaproicibacter melissae]|uniref:peptide deformylase n=1 Tax=Thermocaproicibacter melissae TaxID=2966552 RepID=UPI0024B1449C|nr:peptide deformylase [Thermocaproicibacter melissae]WBY63339.1 peptide deformylase [Thermocaproicibacter melissae]